MSRGKRYGPSLRSQIFSAPNIPAATERYLSALGKANPSSGTKRKLKRALEAVERRELSRLVTARRSG